MGRLMQYCGERGEVSGGLALFVMFVIAYSSWCYYRLIFNNALISYQVCTEEEYKREILSTSGVITLLFSLLYLYRNPFYVALHCSLYYVCLFVLLVLASQEYSSSVHFHGIEHVISCCSCTPPYWLFRSC